MKRRVVGGVTRVGVWSEIGGGGGQISNDDERAEGDLLEAGPVGFESFEKELEGECLGGGGTNDGGGGITKFEVEE